MNDDPQGALVIDGNDGTGKSTLVESLRQRGYKVLDRGIPTKMTDDDALVPPDTGSTYVIVDVPVSVSRERLERAGKDLTEKYHTVEDLTFYRAKYLEVHARLVGHFGAERAHLLDGQVSREDLLAAVEKIACDNHRLDKKY